jgi:hypothetical protein
MSHEHVSKALAYISCLCTLSLFATSMAIAAVNVGRPSVIPCSTPACVAAPGALAVKAPDEAALNVL